MKWGAKIMHCHGPLGFWSESGGLNQPSWAITISTCENCLATVGRLFELVDVGGPGRAPGGPKPLPVDCEEQFGRRSGAVKELGLFPFYFDLRLS